MVACGNGAAVCLRRAGAAVLFGLLAAWAGLAHTQPQVQAQAATGAQALREREAALAPRLARNEFNTPLLIDSELMAGQSRGDVYARVGHPFGAIAAEFVQPRVWCDVLVLHLNVKGCEAGPRGLLVHLGRKFDQPLAQAHRLEFSEFSAVASADYLRVHLAAARGPMDTSDYRLEFEAMPAGGTNGASSFVHLRYSLATGALGRVALRAYLLTLGSAKVGFSPETPGAGATAPRVGGERGMVERNAMRYHLAVVAYLDSLALPAERRAAGRLAAWFDATERHPLQLHEIERDEYLLMKGRELSRAATPARP